MSYHTRYESVSGALTPVKSNARVSVMSDSSPLFDQKAYRPEYASSGSRVVTVEPSNRRVNCPLQTAQIIHCHTWLRPLSA